ncbi:MAG: amidohydrolase family protein [Saprospiraceae bacterium]|nr:amidohydrolase family protein [Saprospiraceae bacterium]
MQTTYPPLKILCIILWIGCSPPLENTADQAEDLEPNHDVTTLPLNDFMPKSIYNVTKTRVAKARYPAIDMHSHPYPKTDEDVKKWVEVLDAKGIDKTVLLTYSTGTRFDSLAELYGAYPDHFILFCGFDYTGYDQPGYGPAAVAELERCVRKGALGVGELGDKGKGLFYSRPTKGYGMHIDDPRMDPLIQRCGELGIPISIHVAEPKWMYENMDATNDGLMNAFKWRLDDEDDILSHTEMLQTLSNALEKHPQTTFIACHYANCSYDLDLLGGLFDRFSNLYADISARYGETAPIPRKVKAFYTKYQNRLVYGTDMGTDAGMYEATFRILETADEHFYDRGHFNYHWPLHSYDLPDDVLKKVYRSNALGILGE